MTIEREIEQCAVFILFAGKRLTDNQFREIKYAYEIHRSGRTHEFVLCLSSRAELPPRLEEGDAASLKEYPIIDIQGCKPREVAAAIMKALHRPFIWDGLPPNPHLFSYEKDIIEHFVKVSRLERAKRLKVEHGLSEDELRRVRDIESGGCPTQWPEVERWDDGTRTLAAEYKRIEVDPREARGKWHAKVGSPRAKKARVIVAALNDYHDIPAHEQSDGHRCCMAELNMSFPEAGPREFLHFPRRGARLRVGILVSGGIAPGTNAVIDGIVQRHLLYAREFSYLGRLNIVGVKNGFLAFDHWGDNSARRDLKAEAINVLYRASEGGSLLGTSRVDELIDDSEGRLVSIAQYLYNSGIDILYIIGGDGSMKAAHALWTVAQEYAAKRNPQQRLSVVAIPMTMDNDILWAWQTFGFSLSGIR